MLHGDANHHGNCSENRFPHKPPAGFIQPPGRPVKPAGGFNHQDPRPSTAASPFLLTMRSVSGNGSASAQDACLFSFPTGPSFRRERRWLDHEQGDTCVYTHSQRLKPRLEDAPRRPTACAVGPRPRRRTPGQRPYRRDLGRRHPGRQPHLAFVYLSWIRLSSYLRLTFYALRLYLLSQRLKPRLEDAPRRPTACAVGPASAQADARPTALQARPRSPARSE